MRHVTSFGIHSDDVGLRYLVQDKVTNAYGFKSREKFKVSTAFGYRRCPHSYEIVSDTKGNDHRTAMVASPIPLRTKAFIAHPDQDLEVLAAFSTAHILPAWMMTPHTIKEHLYSSNISRIIVSNAGLDQSEVLRNMQNTHHSFASVAIFHGEFYFSKFIERLPLLTDVTVTEAKRQGLANMSNYLRDKD